MRLAYSGRTGTDYQFCTVYVGQENGQSSSYTEENCCHKAIDDKDEQ